jgi:hypothetical protein
MESTCCHECDVARGVAVSKLHRDSCSSSPDRRFAAGGRGGGWRRPCGSGRSGRPAARESSPHDSCELIARQSVVHCRPPLHDLRGHFLLFELLLAFASCNCYHACIFRPSPGARMPALSHIKIWRYGAAAAQRHAGGARHLPRPRSNAAAAPWPAREKNSTARSRWCGLHKTLL